MPRLTTLLTTLMVVVAGAQSLARDDASPGNAATRPLRASGPGAGRAESSPAAGERRMTFNRASVEHPETAPAKPQFSAPSRLPLGAQKATPAPDGGGKPTRWLDLQANKPISTVLAALSIVLGVFLLLTWAVRKRLPKGSARLPDEIIEVLGRTALAAKQSLHLVRVGGKLIVVSVTATGTETLTEITDPNEVARILAACQEQHTQSSTTAFRQVFQELGREPAHGFLDSQSDRSTSHAGGRRAA